MKTIYESEFKKTLLNEELSLITNIWSATDMTDAIFQKEILEWVRLVEEYKPKFLIADTQLFIFTISLELQEWTGNVVFPRLIAAGVQKFAIIVSNEMIAQLSIEQTMEEASSAFQSNYFSSIEDAKKWFIK